MMRAEKALVYLDSNVFIDAYEGDEALSQPAQRLLDALRQRPNVAVTSELSLAEVLVKPEAERNSLRKRAYLDLIVWSGVIDLVPITRDIIYDTPKLRAVHPTKLRLADSIHLSTAIFKQCRVLVSRDADLSPPHGMRRMEADRDGVEAILDALR